MMLLFVGVLVCTLAIFYVTPFPRMARETTNRWTCVGILLVGVGVSFVAAFFLVACLFITMVVLS